MRCFLLCSVLIFSPIISSIVATSPPVCGYETLSGKMEFLPYFPYTDSSREYIDFGNNKDGVCIQRAKCSKDYITFVDKCESLKFKVDCEEVRKQTEPSFPSCCTKC